MKLEMETLDNDRLRLVFEGTQEELRSLRERADAILAATEASYDRQLKDFIQRGDMIGAIKLHRSLTGKSLKESKDYCDALRARMGVQGHAQT